MSFVIEYVSGRPFIDGVVGKVIDSGYFCHHDSCPFSLKVNIEKIGGQNVVVGVKSVVFGFHNHEQTKNRECKSKRR